MQITFVSNYINHHQIPLSDELYAQLGKAYHFVQTEPMEEERVKMGWGGEVKELPYLVSYYEQPEFCKKLILESDVVIFGGVEDESYIAPRLEKGLFTIRYSERIYKEGQWKMVSPRGLLKKYHDHIRYRKSDVFLLCSGGYVADDFRLIGAYPQKMMKWGYFVEKYNYDLKELFTLKNSNPEPVILWVGRMLDLKHPEYAVYMAQELKKQNKKFKLRFIGDGEKKEEILELVKTLDLETYVEFLGFMEPKQVRKEMETADILLMTSNRIEGWGAVVNEAMNAGCVVVASHIVGSAPYLIKHEDNGLIFKAGNYKSLTKEVLKIIDNTSYRKEMGIAAYETVDKLWNPMIAARRLIEFCNTKKVDRYEEGPCSKAIPVREGFMYKKLVKKVKI
ncbi:MAG: glycosyltransferase family 4 protein [Lachnospiraceae bacterium]|nr:glycosyltransferase family 4 protein [Lachnospiraceae bacterium]